MTRIYFDGNTYIDPLDQRRLAGQLYRVTILMKDGVWRTLDEIAHATGDASTAAVSARLRDLRKARFGGREVERRRRGDAAKGLFEYRLIWRQHDQARETSGSESTPSAAVDAPHAGGAGPLDEGSGPGRTGPVELDPHDVQPVVSGAPGEAPTTAVIWPATVICSCCQRQFPGCAEAFCEECGAATCAECACPICALCRRCAAREECDACADVGPYMGDVDWLGDR
jgi:hypothetical protein